MATHILRNRGPGGAETPVFATGDVVAFARGVIVAHPELFGITDPATLPLEENVVEADGTTDVSFTQIVGGGRVLDTSLLGGREPQDRCTLHK